MLSSTIPFSAPAGGIDSYQILTPPDRTNPARPVTTPVTGPERTQEIVRPAPGGKRGPDQARIATRIANATPGATYFLIGPA